MLAQLLRRLLALLLVQRRIRVWFGLATTSWHMMARRRRALPAELIFEVLGASRCEKWRQLSDAGAQRQEAAAATGPTGSSVERLARALAAIRIFYAQLANFAGQHTKEAQEERKRFRRWFGELHRGRVPVISGDLWECVKEGEAPLFFSDGHLRCGRYNGPLRVAITPDRFIGAGYLVVFQHAILFLSRENNDNGFTIRRQFVLGTEVAEVSVRKTDLSTFVFTAQPKRSSRRRFWPPSSTQSKSAEVSFMVTDPELDPRFLAGTLHDVKRLNFVGNDDDERCTGRFLCLQLCRLRQRWERMESECAKQADLLFASQLRALEAVADSASEQSLNVQEQRLRDKALELGGQRTWLLPQA